MGSSTLQSADQLSSLGTSDVEGLTRHDDVTPLVWTSDTVGVFRGENLTVSANPTTVNVSYIPSSASMENDTAVGVDLEALNMSMFISLVPTVVYLMVLMVVGMVGNSIVYLVYYRRFKPSATRTYVLAMSVCDFLSNVFSLPSEILDIRYSFTFDLPWLCRAVRATNSFLTLTSAFVLVAVARDRFNKICHPLEKHRPMKRIRIYVLICALASVALSLVFGALNGSHVIPTGVGNHTGITCSVSDEFEGTLFPLIYNAIMALSFISCVAIMTVSYIRIALELWRHKKKQVGASGPASAPSAKDRSKTRNLPVEDGSSGPRHDLHPSDTKSSSTAELIPMKTTGAVLTNPAKTSDKQVLLLSVNNLNYGGPKSSVEESDEGCFSACSTETTSMSADVSKERTDHTDPVTEGGHQTADVHVHVHTVDDPDETDVKKPVTDTQTKPEVGQSAGNDFSGSMGYKAVEDCTITSQDSHSISKDSLNTSQDTLLHSQTKMSTAENKQDSHDGSSHHPHDDQSADNSPQSLHHKTATTTTTSTKPLSLWKTLLTSRKRHHYDVKMESTPKPKGRQIPKRRGTVKSIPSSTTLMMFVLTATFVVNYLPHLLIIIMRVMSDDFGEGLTGAMLNAYNIGLRSYFMNCAINSLVYGFCSARFRQECRLLFTSK